MIYARLGVSRSIYVNVDSPNLGFPYLAFLGGTSEKNTLYDMCFCFVPQYYYFPRSQTRARADHRDVNCFDYTEEDSDGKQEEIIAKKKIM